jgi:aminoglycoside phosphotransferase (APT) family kinase protein
VNAPDIDMPLVRSLIDRQFPRWADQPITEIAHRGWDNRTFRLGDHMLVRLPSSAQYVPQVVKEQSWLPKLAPLLPLPIPKPLALGAPALGYPWPWSVYGWIPGEHAQRERISDLPAFARDLAGFLAALQRIETAGAPAAGEHSFHRGGDLAVYDAEARRCIRETAEVIDAAAATEAWESALASTWQGPPVWVHGDVAVGNLLVRDGRLAAVIDFECSAIGDPACDLVIAWTFLDEASRDAFKAALPLDRSTWLRARGWALWKAMLMITWDLKKKPDLARQACRVVEAVLADRC